MKLQSGNYVMRFERGGVEVLRDGAALYFNRRPMYALIKTALSITESCPQDIDKLKAIYDWVTEHIYYDYVMLADPSAGDISATYTYQTGHSVCEGYARLTKEMGNE